MNAQTARRRVGPRSLIWLLLPAFLCACGSESGHDPVHQKLSLRPVSGVASSSDARIVESFDLALDNAAWSVDAPFKRLMRRPEAELDGGPTHELVCRATLKGETLSLTRRGALDPSRFNRIHLPMRFDGQGYLRADFWRDGVLVGRTEAVRILPTDDLQATGAGSLSTELRLPPAMRFEQAVDTLELHVSGIYRMVALSHVLLVQEPVEGMLPSPQGDGELVRLGLSARRAVGVLSQSPLQRELEIPPGAELRFAYGQPVEELRSKQPARLEVLVDGERVADYVLAAWPNPDEAWHDERVDLSDYAGRSVSVQFRVGVGAPGGAREATPAGDGPALFGCALAEATLVVADPSPPTVVLITTDTHRADHMGYALGGVGVQTPVVDLLAKRGLVFDDCFTPVNVTNPSHVAMMTARSVRTTGVRTNYSRLAEAAPTLAEAFAEAGWMTMAAVSTRHLGADGSGLGQGFDRMSWPRSQPRRRAVDTLKDVVRWLPEAEGRPLFLWVHVFDAHWPYEPEASWVDQYYPPGQDPRSTELPAPAVDPARFKTELQGVRDLDWPRAQYKAEISGQDALLAQVLNAPRIQDGVVALVADHGEALGEHGVYFDHIGLYPSVLHIPLVVAGPGVPIGKRTERPVMHTDLARTLLDLGGLTDVEFPGANLLEPSPAKPRFAIEGYGFSASVTHGGMHLVLNLASRQTETVLEQREHHELELYDLRLDPHCSRNLVTEQRELASRMRHQLIRWLLEVPDRGWAEQRQDDEAFLESLMQLGYVEPSEDVSADLWQADQCDWCVSFEQ